MQEWIRIAGAWRVPAQTVTRPAIECDLPPRWLSRTRPPCPGHENIFPAPILLARKNGDEERINWLPPRQYDRHIANADQIQVILISEANWGPEEGEIELLRFIKHGVARVVLDEWNTSHRRDIIRTLHDREDLRALLAEHVFEGRVEEHQVIQPKQLALLFGGAVKRETFQDDVQFAQLASLIEQAEPIYEQVRKECPELPTMRELIRVAKRRRQSAAPEKQETFVSDVLKNIAWYEGKPKSDRIKLIDGLVKFVHREGGNSQKPALNDR